MTPIGPLTVTIKANMDLYRRTLQKTMGRINPHLIIEEEKPMPMRIHTRKITINGEPYRIIDRIDMLCKEDLPNEYLKQGPCCWKHVPTVPVLSDSYDVGPAYGKKEIKVLYKSGSEVGKRALTIEHPMNEARFQVWVKFFRTCGDRLHKINKERRTVPGFDGRKEVVTI